MTTSEKTRPEPTAADAFFGVGTLAVVLLDTGLIVAFLIGIRMTEWDTASQPWAVGGFLLALLILGLVGGGGMILRSLGGRGGLAGRWPPVIIITARVLLLALIPVAAFSDPSTEWSAIQSVAFVSFYFIPATLVLFALVLVNLGWQREVSSGS